MILEEFLGVSLSLLGGVLGVGCGVWGAGCGSHKEQLLLGVQHEDCFYCAQLCQKLYTFKKLYINMGPILLLNMVVMPKIFHISV